MLPNKYPGYRKQQRKEKPALAFVEINKRRHYLGEYNSPDSHTRYGAIVAEWKSNGQIFTGSQEDLRILELVDRYWQFATGHYRKKDGTATSELDLIRRALAVVVTLYGPTLAEYFNPGKLRAVRETMIEKGWCRKVINDMIQRVRRMFRWGVEYELVPADCLAGLSAVRGLKAGRSAARESQPVRPVPEDAIDPVIANVTPQVGDMIRLQLLTGARPGEICIMRGCDIETSDSIWTYRPESHKTEHHGHTRTIYLGPQAQEIIRKYFRPDLHGYLFSPAEAEQWHRQQREKARTTPYRRRDFGKRGEGSHRCKSNSRGRVLTLRAQ